MISAVVLVVLCVLASSRSAPLQYSDTRYDDVELSTILNNDELYIKLFQCLIGRGKCSPDWEILKDALPGAMLDECDRCTKKQKLGTTELLAHLVHQRPQDMRLLEGEFDPDASYRMQLEKTEKEEEEKRTNVISNTKRSANVENVDAEFIQTVRRIIKK